MGNITDTSWKKYYMYRHKNGENVEYCTDHSWESTRNNLRLFEHESEVETMCNNGNSVNVDGFRYCVGRVIIDIDRFYIHSEKKNV